MATWPTASYTPDTTFHSAQLATWQPAYQPMFATYSKAAAAPSTLVPLQKLRSGANYSPLVSSAFDPCYAAHQPQPTVPTRCEHWTTPEHLCSPLLTAQHTAAPHSGRHFYNPTLLQLSTVHVLYSALMQSCCRNLDNVLLLGSTAYGALHISIGASQLLTPHYLLARQAYTWPLQSQPSLTAMPERYGKAS